MSSLGNGKFGRSEKTAPSHSKTGLSHDPDTQTCMKDGWRPDRGSHVAAKDLLLSERAYALAFLKSLGSSWCR
jgi:hypothetical protein